VTGNRRHRVAGGLPSRRPATGRHYPGGQETRVLADRYKKHYNLDYRPPAPEASAPWPPSFAVPAAHTN